MVVSRYEKNVLQQPELIRRILDAPAPAWFATLKRRKRVFFVGVGSSFHAAQISQRLWRRFVSTEAWAEHSFDFVKEPQPVDRGDVVVLFSHRATKSYTVQAAAKAKKAGATTVAVTGVGAKWSVKVDYRLDSCELEDTGAFTKSLTTTLAWIARWIGTKKLLDGLRTACDSIAEGPAFPTFAADTDVVLVGDLEGEWVAREASLKLEEAAYLRARPFGLEEFLHGPQISAAQGSFVLGFPSDKEPRWDALRGYLRTVEVPLMELPTRGLGPEAAWLWRIFWVQRMTAAICSDLSIDPDALRDTDPRYLAAKKSLAL